DDDAAVCGGHRPREASVDAVAPEQVGDRLGVDEVVDRHPLDVELALVGGAEGGAARPAEAVDRDADAHGLSFRTEGRARRPSVSSGGPRRGPPRLGCRLGWGLGPAAPGFWPLAANFSAVSGFRRAPPMARMANPIPVRRSATPTTIPNSASWEAM